MFAPCGLVGNPHLPAKIISLAPLPMSTKFSWNHPGFGNLGISSIPSDLNRHLFGFLVPAFKSASPLGTAEMSGALPCRLVEPPSAGNLAKAEVQRTYPSLN